MNAGFLLIIIYWAYSILEVPSGFHVKYVTTITVVSKQYNKTLVNYKKHVLHSSHQLKITLFIFKAFLSLD